MPEAVSRVLQFAFNDLNLNRVECVHALPNEKSGRVMQKTGMTFEGIARERMFAKVRYWDVKQYAILRSDWNEKGLEFCQESFNVIRKLANDCEEWLC